MHAADIAAELSIRTVVVPPVAGCLSAVGLVVSDVTHDHAVSFPSTLDVRIIPDLTKALAGLRSQARAQLADEGVLEAQQHVQLALDLHYAGQNSSITVPVDERFDDDRWLERVQEHFHAEHERANGFRVPAESIGIVSARASGIGRITRTDLRPRATTPSEPTPTGGHELVTGANEIVRLPTFDRGVLTPGNLITGPAVIRSADTTLIVPPRSTTRMDGYGNLLMQLGAR